MVSGNVLYTFEETRSCTVAAPVLVFANLIHATSEMVFAAASARPRKAALLPRPGGRHADDPPRRSIDRKGDVATFIRLRGDHVPIGGRTKCGRAGLTFVAPVETKHDSESVPAKSPYLTSFAASNWSASTLYRKRALFFIFGRYGSRLRNHVYLTSVHRSGKFSCDWTPKNVLRCHRPSVGDLVSDANHAGFGICPPGGTKFWKSLWAGQKLANSREAAITGDPSCAPRRRRFAGR